MTQKWLWNCQVVVWSLGWCEHSSGKFWSNKHHYIQACVCTCEWGTGAGGICSVIISTEDCQNCCVQYYNTVVHSYMSSSYGLIYFRFLCVFCESSVVYLAWFIHRHFCHTPRICNLILLLISMLYCLCLTLYSFVVFFFYFVQLFLSV